MLKILKTKRRKDQIKAIMDELDACIEHEEKCLNYYKNKLYNMKDSSSYQSIQNYAEEIVIYDRILYVLRGLKKEYENILKDLGA